MHAAVRQRTVEPRCPTCLLLGQGDFGRAVCFLNCWILPELLQGFQEYTWEGLPVFQVCIRIKQSCILLLGHGSVRIVYGTQGVRHTRLSSHTSMSRSSIASSTARIPRTTLLKTSCLYVSCSCSVNGTLWMSRICYRRFPPVSPVMHPQSASINLTFRIVDFPESPEPRSRTLTCLAIFSFV